MRRRRKHLPFRKKGWGVDDYKSCGIVGFVRVVKGKVNVSNATIVVCSFNIPSSMN
jgi:hypothetical protein